MSGIKISTAKTIPVAVNSIEAKRIRLEMEERAATEVLANMSVSDNSTDMSRETLYTCDTDSDSDSEKEKEKSDSTKRRYNTTDISPIIAASVNCFASSYMTAAIATATLVAYGIVTPGDDTHVICEQKVQKAKDRWLEKISANRNVAVSLPGVVTMVSFDASQAKMPLREKEIAGKNHVVNGDPEDQYMVVNEPQGQYLTHFTVDEDATKERPYALLVAEKLKNSVEDLGVSWQNVKITGHDTENTNTGKDKGVVACLEHLIGHKLERAPCLLHMNELYYRAVCVNMGVKTLSGNKWTGPIGALLPKVKDLEYNDEFVPVPGQTELVDLPPEVLGDLSADQKTLYRLLKMVKTGEKIPHIEEYQPGALGSARWLTQAASMLRMYFSKHGLNAEESRKLQIIVNTIIEAYGPMWFEIKSKPTLKDAPRHWFKLLQITNRLDEEVRDIVKKNISRNSYYFFSESILLCLAASEVRAEREYAVKMIKLIRCRQEDPTLGRKIPRVRQNPKKLNFSASSLDEVITEQEYQHESLLTCDIPYSELDNLLDVPLQVLPYPSNTQSVERNVRRMGQAGRYVSTQKKRDGVMLTQQVISKHYNSKKKKTKKDLLSLTKLSSYAESLNNHKLQPKPPQQSKST